MDRSPELTKAAAAAEPGVEDQPKPLPTIEELAEIRTPEEIVQGFQHFFEQYQIRKRLALVANPPGTPTDLALKVMVDLSFLELRVEALLDELQGADPKRDLRICLRLIKKLHDTMEQMPAIQLAPGPGGPKLS